MQMHMTTWVKVIQNGTYIWQHASSAKSSFLKTPQNPQSQSTQNFGSAPFPSHTKPNSAQTLHAS